MITPRKPLPDSRRFSVGLAAAVVAAAAFLPALAQAEPDAQMTEVLDAYGKLSPVPIGKTTPAVAKAAPVLATAEQAKEFAADGLKAAFTK